MQWPQLKGDNSKHLCHFLLSRKSVKLTVYTQLVYFSMRPFAVALLLALVGAVVCEEACKASLYTGYKVDYSIRECVTVQGKACSNPFPYSTMEECEKDFRGRGNICERRRHACRHGGTCMPISLENGERSFKCLCAGTGHYGKHCQHKCHKDTKDSSCIVA